MSRKIISIILGTLLLINIASAITIYAGSNYTFPVNTTKTLSYSVTGNSTNITGVEISQDIYSNYSNITISIAPNFKPDNFTLVFFVNETEEVIIEVPVGGGSGGGGGGGRRYFATKPENKTNETIVICNDTEIKDLNDRIKELEDKIIIAQDDLNQKEVMLKRSTINFLILTIMFFVSMGVYWLMIRKFMKKVKENGRKQAKKAEKEVV